MNLYLHHMIIVIFSTPLPFEFRFKPRSEAALALLNASVAAV